MTHRSSCLTAAWRVWRSWSSRIRRVSSRGRAWRCGSRPSAISCCLAGSFSVVGTRSPTCGETCWGNGSAPTETLFVVAALYLDRHFSLSSPFHTGDSPQGKRKTNHQLTDRAASDDWEGLLLCCLITAGAREVTEFPVPEFNRSRRGGARVCVALNPLPVVHCVLLYIYLKPIAPPRAPYYWLLPQFLVQWYTLARIHLLFRSTTCNRGGRRGGYRPARW